jgi:hypothetical protein
VYFSQFDGFDIPLFTILFHFSLFYILTAANVRGAGFAPAPELTFFRQITAKFYDQSAT